jgi:hypothetical protein
LLAFELRQDITQRLTARVQSLGQPSPHAHQAKALVMGL